MMAVLGRAVFWILAVNVFVLAFLGLLGVIGFYLEKKEKDEKKRARPPYETTREAPAPPPREIDPKRDGVRKPTTEEEEALRQLLQDVGGR